ncbi:hypothetical protein ACHAWU_003988 [Discostella pseudostelligera]|uniref:Uncharacterized protein n=1 Tax=Discostella pseudostelligera TaxID=259834 RepID=A0ABD3MJC0_9STRA
MTASKVRTLQPSGNSSPGSVERSDAAARSGLCGESGMFSWCEVDMIQDAVCGNGFSLSVMESRDDDQCNSPNTGSIFDAFKTLEQDHELSKSKSFPQYGGYSKSFGNNTLAVAKEPSTASLLETLPTSAFGGIEKSRYDQFMRLLKSASTSHGANSTQVADLYVTMSTEIGEGSDSTASSKEIALHLLDEAFGIYQALLGDSQQKTIDCRVQIGKICQSLERYDEALECFCMAAYMREALVGVLHPSVSDVWVQISSVHYSKSKFELALKASAKALTGYRNAYGDKHRTVIAVLKTIAQIHIQMGNQDKAVDIQKYVRLHSPKGDTM